MTVECRTGRLRLAHFKNKLANPPREYVAEATVVAPFALASLTERFTVVPVWSKFLPSNASVDPSTDNVRITVKRGELIGFAVGPHGSYPGDQTQWTTSLQYEDGERYSSTSETKLEQGPLWYYYIQEPNSGALELLDSVEQQNVAQELVRIPGASNVHRAPGDVPHVGTTMLHPSDRFNAVRVWKAPRDGTVAISGVAQHVRGFSDVDLQILRITEKANYAATAPASDAWTVRKGEMRQTTAAGRPAAELELSLSQAALGPVIISLHLVAYPGSSMIRQWVELRNPGPSPVSFGQAQPFTIGLSANDSSEFKQLWMIGANCEANQGTIPELPITEGFHHTIADNGTRQLVPWTSLQRTNDAHDGWFLMLEQEGPWSIAAEREGRGATLISAGSFGFQAPAGGSYVLPVVTVGVYTNDLEDLGRRIYDWDYEYLWDYTHHDWYARTLHLDAFNNFWSDKNWNLQEKFTARLMTVMASAQVMLRTGEETLWDDIAWWENGTPDPFNGPDFARTGRFLAKGGMKSIAYFTGDPGLPVLANKVGAWGNVQWRTDFCTWGRGNPDGIRPQEVRDFLDRFNRCSFHSCSGGGGYNHSFQVRELADVNQMSDASPDQSNYYFSYIEPPDKWQNTFGSGEGAGGKFNWDLHRRILTHLPSWYASPGLEDQEAVRNTVDRYHFLLENGLAGRWSYMFHPAIQGDREFYYAQRTSYDRKKACVILKHRATNPVTIYPRGLIPAHSYVVGFDSKRAAATRLGDDLMANGIVMTNQPPGELIYLGLAYWPGSGLDKTPPTPPGRVFARREVNVGRSGVSLYWSAAIDDHWVSYYEIRRGQDMVGRASARTYYFDCAPGWDAAADYSVRAVDGDDNPSAWQSATRLPEEGSEFQALGGHFERTGQDGWSAETSVDGETFQPMTWVPPGAPGERGSLDGYWEGAGTARVGRGWQQSSTSAQCIRAWTATESGTVRVIGRAAKEFFHRYGSTLRARILLGTKRVWPQEGWAEAVQNDLTGATHDIKLALAKGDTLRFVLDKGASPTNELLAWMPRIVYEKSEPAAKQLSVVRILCGAEDPYVDRLGNVWSADQYYTGGHPLKSNHRIAAVQPTPKDQTLYRRGRAGTEFTYSIPVEHGLYSLRLKFAETEYPWFFERPFNLEINGRRVLRNFDVCQAARGSKRAYEQVFRYLAPDEAGRLVLRFTGGWEPRQKSNEAMVQAIEIVPELKPAIRIHCGSMTDFIDWNGFIWSADAFFAGGQTKEWTPPGIVHAEQSRPQLTGKETCSPPFMSCKGDPAIVEVTPTLLDQALYGTVRTGKSFRYAIPAPPGLYSVHLKFAELWMKEGDLGMRPMNIEVNGRRVWENWDPATAAGRTRAAADLRVEDVVPDKDGRIVIQANGTGAEDAILQAIEIE